MVSGVAAIPRWRRRRPAAALLLVLACLGWHASHLLKTQRDLARRAETAARQAEQAAQQAQTLAVAREHLASATSIRISDIPGRRAEALHEIRKAMNRDPTGDLCDALRTEAIAALAMVDVRMEAISWQDLLASDDFATVDTQMGKIVNYHFAANLRRRPSSMPGATG